MAEPKTITVWNDTRGKAHCRGCGAPIEWAKVVASGKKMCFNNAIVPLRTETDPHSRRVIVVADLATNHWATCPDRDRFRRKR